MGLSARYLFPRFMDWTLGAGFISRERITALGTMYRGRATEGATHA
jgi:hypothetical protein